MNAKLADSLVLGTVQLGTNYGIANSNGQPSLEEARRIIEVAYQEGVRYFDTAQAYGSSEVVLGKILPFYSEVKVISKFAPDLEYLNKDTLNKAFDKTVETLGMIPFGMMLHRYDWMKDWDNGLREIIQQIVIAKGVHFGVSVYSLEEAESLMEIKEVTLIQIPFNVFSKKMVDKDIFGKARKASKIIFLRSTFLQGLLLMEPEKIPAEMSFVKEHIKHLYDFCSKNGVRVKEFCLGYSLFKSENVAKVIFGAETENQVSENIQLAKNISINEKTFIEWEKLLLNLNIPEQLLNPSLWPKLKKKGV